ncbi:O-methyltransferase [Aggregatilineales bacterium SYSU G02658]
MSQALWSALDDYFDQALLQAPPVLAAALANSAAAGLPTISVAPNQGKLLATFVAVMQAKRVLEIGTLGGYSTLWMAHALPTGGQIITLELNDHHADVAQQNFALAGMADRIEIRRGPALATLDGMIAEGAPPFDLIFIDADKPATPDYFQRSLALSRLGTLIIIDNVVREGAVLDVNNPDPNVQGIRRLIAEIAAEPRVSALALQTVGSKGHDGLALAVVTG